MIILVHTQTQRNYTMKKLTSIYLLAPLFAFIGCSSSDNSDTSTDYATSSPVQIETDHEGTTQSIHVKSTREWSIYSDENWISVSPTSSLEQEGIVTATIAANSYYSDRSGTIVVKAGTARSVITVQQTGKPKDPVDESITVPEGYELVWNDEFNEGAIPGIGLCY